MRLHAHGQVPAALTREYPDLDFVTSRPGGADAERLLPDLGYEANQRFNATNGARRLVFYDRTHERHIDVFVGRFEMCHRIPLEDRLDADAPTISLADLLLTKLQVVALNRKDAVDVTTMLLQHDVGSGDAETVNQDYIAGLLAADWGLWRTITRNVGVVGEVLPSLDLADDERVLVSGRLERLLAHIEGAAKTRRWRARARIGERRQWYEEPEEIAHDKPGSG